MNKSLSIKPNINDNRLIKKVNGKDHLGNPYSQNVVMERPLTIFLNKQEVVTSMTVGDHPEWMAIGFLVNQGMLSKDDNITSIDLDWETEVIVVTLYWIDGKWRFEDIHSPQITSFNQE